MVIGFLSLVHQKISVQLTVSNGWKFIHQEKSTDEQKWNSRAIMIEMEKQYIFPY